MYVAEMSFRKDGDRTLRAHDSPQRPSEIGTSNAIATGPRRGRTTGGGSAAPSWVLSLTTHLALLVIVSALASPLGNAKPSGPIVLQMSGWGDKVRQETVAFRPTPSSSEPDVQRDEPGNEARVKAPSVASRRRVDMEKPTPTADKHESRWHKKMLESRPSPQAYWGFAAPKGPLPNTQQLASWISNRPLNSYEVRRSDDADAVVDRFIEYDIGRLTGSEGARARREFEQLGPKSIPALVRGLNKSAGIRASCPVAVIARRLDQVLRESSDPTMIRYALDHVGQDVSSSDPHYRSVRSLVKKWKQQFANVLFSRRDAFSDQPLRPSWAIPRASDRERRPANRTNEVQVPPSKFTAPWSRSHPKGRIR